MTPFRRYLPFLLLAVLLLAGWWGTRAGLEDRLAQAARRGLDTIIDLVAADLERAARRPDSQSGTKLVHAVATAYPEWRRTLASAGSENRRRIYFFDAGGYVVDIDMASQPAPEIVLRALAGGKPPDAARRGARFEPYPGLDGELAVGAWRWLPEAGLGVVAERPHAYFALALRWIDGIFAALLGLVLAGWAFFALGGWRTWRERRRRRESQWYGPYRVERLLGEGAMSRVYLARHHRLNRVVALKVLKLHMQSDELSHRFDREARLASRLAHPNIVTLFDHGPAPGGGFYYAMEYVPGITLTQWVEAHGPLPPDRVIRLLRQITAAVAAMHGQHLLHRDIKPDNVMAYAAHGEADLIKLLDFGLIRDFGQDASRDLTRDVRVLGTPAFMAPERLFDPGLIDPRTDLYGIGCIGFYLLTGRRPFESDIYVDLAQRIRMVEAPRAGELAPHPVPEPLEALIADCLAKDIHARPPDAEALLWRLDEVALSTPWNAAEARAWWRNQTERDGVKGAPPGPPAAACTSPS